MVKVILIKCLFFILLLSISPHYSLIAALNPKLNIVTVDHTCSGEGYFEDKIKLSTAERKTIRDIMSYLYHGAVVMISYPGSPEKPPVNELSKKKFTSSPRNAYLLMLLKDKDIKKPTAEQIEKEFLKQYEIDPITWHVNQGPTDGELKQIITGKIFLKRATPELIKLIEERIQGKVGNRDKIIDLLIKNFGLKKDGKFEGSKHCHIGDDLGSN